MMPLERMAMRIEMRTTWSWLSQELVELLVLLVLVLVMLVLDSRRATTQPLKE